MIFFPFIPIQSLSKLQCVLFKFIAVSSGRIFHSTEALTSHYSLGKSTTFFFFFLNACFPPPVNLTFTPKLPDRHLVIRIPLLYSFFFFLQETHPLPISTSTSVSEQPAPRDNSAAPAGPPLLHNAELSRREREREYSAIKGFVILRTFCSSCSSTARTSCPSRFFPA